MEISLYIKQKISEIIKSEFKYEISVQDIHLEHPNNEKWGDYATNVAMKIASTLKQSPLEIAKKVGYELQHFQNLIEIDGREYEMFKKIDILDPGFINFTLSEELLLNQSILLDFSTQESNPKYYIGQLRGQNILFEYTDPNPFKVFHIGHLMSNAIGESLSRIFEYSGANIRRVNYQGDVGMHVAKSIWGIFKNLEEKNITFSDIESKDLRSRIEFLGESYAIGATAYKDDKKAQEEIRDLNYFAYIAGQERLVEEENWIPLVDYRQFLSENPKYDYEQVKEIYFKGRKWSLEHFEQIYEKLGTKFDDYYFESKVGEYGLDIVLKNIENGVFTKDQGAVIFKGEDHGLHTRVFINSHGLPTYEAKDLGLAPLKYEDYKYDKSYIVTANEIDEYFKVVLKAMEKIDPSLSEKTRHVGHGMMVYSSGKMSSRTGDVISGIALINDTKTTVLDQMSSNSNLSEDKVEEVAESLSIGAIKYSILKHGPGKDIVFDKQSSLEITGNTGPYLQYTHARANSVLDKAPEWEDDPAILVYELSQGNLTLEEKELSILRQISKFYDMVDLSIKELSPNLMAEYAFDLAQRFNAFYNDISILGAEDNLSQNFRLKLTKQVRDVIKSCLWMLGIKAPDSV